MHHTAFRSLCTLVMILMIVVSGAALSGARTDRAAAQAAPDGSTLYSQNVRCGPGKQFPSLTVLPGNTPLFFEARNEDTSWVLAHTEDNRRGWVSVLFLRFRPGFQAANLPVSDEVLPPPEPAAPPASSAGASGSAPAVSVPGAIAPFDPSRVAGIDLTAYPILPANLGRAREIFLAGRAIGRSPHALSKVGDCASDHPDFLAALVRPDRNLGAYGDALLPVITQFADSLTADSQAAHPGFNAATLTDPMWTNPASCLSGETTLQCEFRLRNPAIAVIMFGTTDLQTLSPAQFDAALRTVVAETMRAGVIPLLSTFPPHSAFPAESLLYNKIVVRIALDYSVPLVNLWLALQPLPNQGMAADGTHLSEPVYGGPGWLVPQNLEAGLPVHNLVTMQAVDVIWRRAMQ